MKRIIWIIFLVTLTAFCFPLNSEATEQPTKVIQPDSILESLKIYSPSLPVEIARLPDYQGNIEGSRLVALNRLYSIVKNSRPDQMKNLELYLNIGILNKRSYCTPLQALLWVLEKEHDVDVLNYMLTQLLDKAWVFSELNRWQDYKAVTDRLNAPELLSYYQRIRFEYESRAGKRDSTIGDPRGLFANNIGNCYDHSEFAAYCLKRAGYKTSIVRVHPSQPYLHVVCRYEANGKSYYIDNGRPDKFLRRGIIPKEEYEMYREKENVRKGERTKDPVYLLQDNHGLTLVYLTVQKERVTSVKTICKDLGTSGFEEKVRNECIPALIDSGFITKPIPHKGGGSEDFQYTINEPLCERFMAARYHRPQNAAAKW